MHDPKRCPLCGLRERAAVSEESRRRDVSQDTWRLTTLGERALIEFSRRQRARARREGATR